MDNKKVRLNCSEKQLLKKNWNWQSTHTHIVLFICTFFISEVKCPVIQVADNVQATGNVEDGGYGDVIQFECQSLDMQLSGPGEIHCTKEGKWSEEIPTCKGK